MKKIISFFLWTNVILFILQSKNIYCEEKCNNLIILLDPTHSEGIDTPSKAISSSFITALQEKAAPILTTTNLVKNVCFWKSEHKDMLAQIKQVILETPDVAAKEKKIADIIQLLDPTKKVTFPSTNFAIPLSMIEFSDDDWLCFIHNTADLILLIPKKYLSSKSTTKSSHSILNECGFRATDLTNVQITPLESLLNSINNKDAATSDLITAISSCLATPSSSNASWNIFLSGHGSPAKKKSVFIKEVPSITDSYKTWQQILSSWRSLNSQKDLNASLVLSKPIEEEYEITQRLHLFKDEDLIPQTAHIAGLSFNQFFGLMKIFNTHNTSFFYYATCFGGGYNRTFVNDILQKLNVTFITVAEGYNESSTYSSLPTFISDKKGTLALSRTPFTNFFNRLNIFFGKPKKSSNNIQQPLGKDPIATILKGLIDIQNLSTNQPFVRIPSVGTFQALEVDKNVKILTNSIIKAYEFENKTINLMDPNIRGVLIFPEKINVPIHMTGSVSLIFPTPQNSIKKNIIHIFENIVTNSWLNIFLYKLINSNNNYGKTTIIIKNLQCNISEKMNISPHFLKPVWIKNLIIHINSNLTPETTTKFSTTIEITFSCNNNDFSYEYESTDIAQDRYKLLEIFDMPATSISTEILQKLSEGNNFMSLSAIVQQYEKKIDTSTNVQELGSLKKIVLLKKLDSLELATNKEGIKERIAWTRKKRRPLTVVADQIKKQQQNLISLQKEISMLSLTQQEQATIAKKINIISHNIQNVDQIITQAMSEEGYFSRIIDKIKETGQSFYDWLSSVKK